MKSRLRAAILGVAIVVATSTALRSETSVALLRQLQDIQDESAFGIADHRARRNEIRSRLASSVVGSAYQWADSRNSSALGLFLLTGGDPGFARKLVALAPREGPGVSLMQHALSYAEGDIPQASKQLERVDLRKVSPEIAGALALVQAKLLMDRDRKSAVEKLLSARVLAPGGLIEESALRQQLFALDSESDPDSFRRIVSRYFSRFNRSDYVENFVKRLESLSEQMWASRSLETRAMAAVVLEELPSPTRSRVALHVARSSLMMGDRAAVRKALDIGCPDVTANGSVEGRCALYRQIDEVASVDKMRDNKIVAQLSTLRSSDEDRLLMECASLVSANSENSYVADQSQSEHRETEAMRRIQELIVEARRLLRGAR